MHEFSKGTEYKIDTQSYFFTFTVEQGENEINKTVSFIIASKIKYERI